ncbi:response regulator transcription factor [Sulfurovum sp. XGS-02]|uniref:response regulator transcription factor n=1 Tax=Sulfurovum sp. XGS-02 TaxID=2925411 RepID=UPI00205931E5|nr:response regulator transcription factor [Sulfurovum sp. XGS-02]UPT76573.1 response regulator transcription factor [Sulfurovum sp. XGS-02]
MKILLLEDDIGLADIMSEYLEDNDFELDLVYDGEEALDKAYETQYDLYIFDVNVPAIKGFDLLKTLRDNGDATPTIFVTSLNDIEDVSQGFESGADDYLKKPFELAELLLRIKNIQKRSFAQKRSTLIQIDKDITFDIDTELLHTNGESVSLPQKELKLLKHFLKHPNEVVTFESLYDVLWDYDETASAESLRAHIKNLRKHLTKDMIQNLRGLGYRFEMETSDR